MKRFIMKHFPYLYLALVPYTDTIKVHRDYKINRVRKLGSTSHWMFTSDYEKILKGEKLWAGSIAESCFAKFPSVLKFRPVIVIRMKLFDLDNGLKVRLIDE